MKSSFDLAVSATLATVLLACGGPEPRATDDEQPDHEPGLPGPAEETPREKKRDAASSTSFRLAAEGCPADLTLGAFSGQIVVSYVRDGAGLIDTIWPAQDVRSADTSRGRDFDPGRASRDHYLGRMTGALIDRPPAKEKGGPTAPRALTGMCLVAVDRPDWVLDARFHEYASTFDQQRYAWDGSAWSTPAPTPGGSLIPGDLRASTDAWGAPVLENLRGGDTPLLSQALEPLFREELEADPARLQVEAAGMALLAWQVRPTGSVQAVLRYEAVEAGNGPRAAILVAEWNAALEHQATEQLDLNPGESARAVFGHDSLFILKDGKTLTRYRRDSNKSFATPKHAECAPGDVPAQLVGVRSAGTPWLRLGRCIFRLDGDDWQREFISPAGRIDSVLGLESARPWVRLASGVWWSRDAGSSWVEVGALAGFENPGSHAAVSADGHLWVAVRTEAATKDAFHRPIGETKVWSTAGVERRRCRRSPFEN